MLDMKKNTRFYKIKNSVLSAYFKSENMTHRNAEDKKNDIPFFLYFFTKKSVEKLYVDDHGEF